MKRTEGYLWIKLYCDFMIRSLFVFVLCSLSIAANAANKYSVLSAAAPVGTGTFCSGATTSGSYTDVWAPCTGSGGSNAAVTYQWKLDAGSIAGATGTFTVTAAISEPRMDNAGAIAEQRAGLDLQLVPNPAENEVAVSYTNANKVMATVRIINAAGAVILTQDLGTQQKGSAVIALDGLASGIYMVELTSGADKKTVKLIKE